MPSGRDADIYDPTTVTGVQSDGSPSYVDEDTISFTPPPNYRGPAEVELHDIGRRFEGRLEGQRGIR